MDKEDMGRMISMMGRGTQIEFRGDYVLNVYRGEKDSWRFDIGEMAHGFFDRIIVAGDGIWFIVSGEDHVFGEICINSDVFRSFKIYHGALHVSYDIK